ncbi:SsrA-binding protein SmpB [bacterium]|nr:SsrA-binding protein SmpB [bacterium]
MSKLLVSNKKAFFNYEILDKYECGISLKGSEVKSVIKSSVSLDEAFCIIRKQELFIINMYIAHFDQGNLSPQEASRTRKLLAHKSEILKIEAHLKKFSATLIPLNVYVTKKKIKVSIAIAKRKNKHDKRESKKQKADKREIKKYI